MRDGGANFAVTARHATRIEVCLYAPDGETELCRIPLDRRLDDIHYGFIRGLKAGQRYGLRAQGPWNPDAGHRYDEMKLLVDPCATALDRPFVYSPLLAQRGADTAGLVPLAILTDALPDCEALPRPETPGLIYELGVRSFTMLHPAVPEAKRGTIAALAEPAIIDYFKQLHIDTIELMPIAAWIDERHLSPLGLTNAWGYNPVAFMAPDPRLAPGGMAEIAETVRILHAHDLRVVLDVVFNHTGESDALGPTLSLRGLDNALYYRHTNGVLANDAGCGNVLACDEPAAIALIMDTLRHWATKTGVDGFRFDLATVLGRTASGFSNRAPLLAAIAQDHRVRTRMLIAEPWDVGPGGYRVGEFELPWFEWNDRFIGDVRRFWRGDAGSANALSTRLAGSSDIFASPRKPAASINYVAAHDGFTLRDATAFAYKNNFANGEDNRDGNGGEVTLPGGSVQALLATLFFSRGTPMLTAGDEFGRTQGGNNNAYAQDNATTWLNWLEADQELIALVSELSAVRKKFQRFFRGDFLTGLTDGDTGLADALWFDATGNPLDWQDGTARFIGLCLAFDDDRIAVLINGSRLDVEPGLPPRSGHHWVRVLSSAPGHGAPASSVTLWEELHNPASGISDDLTARLAEAAHIDREWWEVDGTYHRVTPEVLRHLLSALKLDIESERHGQRTLRDLKNRPGLRVVRAGEEAVIAEARSHRGEISLVSEKGARRTIIATPGLAPAVALSPGIWEIEGENRWIISAPAQCHMPTALQNGGRAFGITSHLYCLRHAQDEGIGDFETLHRFAQKSRDAGAALTGLNPLHHLFPADRSRVSPYQPSDRRFIDPLYINCTQMLDMLHLPKTAQLTQECRAAFAEISALPLVNYALVWQMKSRLLESAFAEFKSTPDFEAFCLGGGETLIRHGRYEALRAEETPTPERIRYRAFLQWLAEIQLARAGENGTLYRDLAIGSAFDSGERHDFAGHFARGVSLGAPPDPLARQGQVWALPPFSPLALEDSGLMPFHAILGPNMRHAAALRIDHVLGFSRQFWVPEGADGAQGSYIRFPRDGLIALTALLSHEHECLIVGEDLGTVAPGLREALSAADILSYKVLLLEHEGASFKPPGTYPRAALACLSSHDLPTFAGWRMARDVAIARSIDLMDEAAEKAALEERKREMAALDALVLADHVGPVPIAEASAATHGALAAGPAMLMVVQADDLAGETEPLNLPGTWLEYPNWRRRVSIPVENLTDQPLARAILEKIVAERPSGTS